MENIFLIINAMILTSNHIDNLGYVPKRIQSAFAFSAKCLCRRINDIKLISTPVMSLRTIAIKHCGLFNQAWLNNRGAIFSLQLQDNLSANFIDNNRCYLSRFPPHHAVYIVGVTMNDPYHFM